MHGCSNKSHNGNSNSTLLDQAASFVPGVLIGHLRVAPIIEAVLAQISLEADLLHTFMDTLRRE